MQQRVTGESNCVRHLAVLDDHSSLKGSPCQHTIFSATLRLWINVTLLVLVPCLHENDPAEGAHGIVLGRNKIRCAASWLTCIGFDPVYAGQNRICLTECQNSPANTRRQNNQACKRQITKVSIKGSRMTPAPATGSLVFASVGDGRRTLPRLVRIQTSVDAAIEGIGEGSTQEATCRCRAREGILKNRKK